MLVIAFLVGNIIGAISTKKRKPEDEAPDIEQNDRKWEINEERLKKLRAEISQALKENGEYVFDSKTDKGYEGRRWRAIRAAQAFSPKGLLRRKPHRQVHKPK